MAEIPESLLRRSAEAKAKALGVPVEQILAEMRGEAPPTPPPAAAAAQPESSQPESSQPESSQPESTQPESTQPESTQPESVAAASEPAPAEAVPAETAPAQTTPAGAVAVADAPAAAESGNGHSGNGSGRVAATVSPRPVAPPTGAPEGVRTQRLLTVVKAKAIQQVKAEPTDKVNTWPHLMLIEFVALLAITALLLVMSVVIHSPLLEPANVNATPNPSKAPWYFLGLQELLSYFDPQIAGVTVPTIVGLIGFMMIPYVDRNPSTKPSDRKFAIMLYTIFLCGSATLSILGVLFRGRGFNFSYPWRDGVFFDDLKDWVHFE